MALKMFRGVWFLSMLGVMANLLYVYAGLPEMVVVQDEASGRVLAGREPLFYGMLAIILMTNVLVYVFAKIFLEEDFRTWFYGLVISINIFFVLAMNLVQTYNSGEHFDFSSISPIIYSSIGLVMLWAVSWPMYSIFRKIFPKQAVL